MLVENQKVKVKWNKRTRKHYEDKGYIFTNKGDWFEVDVRDLTKGSHTLVNVKCDYCGEIIPRPYSAYLKYYDGIDTCRNCFDKKRKQNFTKKFGVQHHNQLEENRKKTSERFLTPFEEVCQLFKERGFTLLTNKNEFKGIYKNLKYLCPKHGLQKMTLSTFKKSPHGCKECSYEYLRKIKQEDYEKVRFDYENAGFTLLEKEYLNQSIPMKCICKKHPEIVQEKNYGSIKGGNICLYCYLENNTGENSGNYKGGVTPLHNYLRTSIDQWKKESMENCNYRCIITGQTFNHIHHLYSFNKILKELLETLNLPLFNEIGKYSDEELFLLKETNLKLHYKYGLGVCLNKDIHDLYHKYYKNDNTPEQFEEFTKRYYLGEFEEVI